VDFFIADTRYHWASFSAYGIILAYYLYVVYLYFQGKADTMNKKFAMAFLSFKVIILGGILAFFYFMKIFYPPASEYHNF
jgi:hypothetical protein